MYITEDEYLDCYFANLGQSEESLRTAKSLWALPR